jgi:hypothetical protein
VYLRVVLAACVHGWHCLARSVYISCRPLGRGLCLGSAACKCRPAALGGRGPGGVDSCACRGVCVLKNKPKRPDKRKGTAERATSHARTQRDEKAVASRVHRLGRVAAQTWSHPPRLLPSCLVDCPFVDVSHRVASSCPPEASVWLVWLVSRYMYCFLLLPIATYWFLLARPSCRLVSLPLPRPALRCLFALPAV